MKSAVAYHDRIDWDEVYLSLGWPECEQCGRYVDPQNEELDEGRCPDCCTGPSDAEDARALDNAQRFRDMKGEM